MNLKSVRPSFVAAIAVAVLLSGPLPSGSSNSRARQLAPRRRHPVPAAF